MAQAQYIDPVQQQDGLRPFRNFVSFLSGAVSDQTYAETDGYAVNYPRQFSTQGPNGVALEGQPVVLAAPAGAQPAIPPVLLVGAVVVAAVMLLK